MIAPDSALTPRGRISAASLDTLERALADHLATSGDEAPVRVALEQVADEARRQSIPPEELLVELKHLWARLTPPASRHATQEPARELQRLVTMCIKAYYR